MFSPEHRYIPPLCIPPCSSEHAAVVKHACTNEDFLQQSFSASSTTEAVSQRSAHSACISRGPVPASVAGFHNHPALSMNSPGIFSIPANNQEQWRGEVQQVSWKPRAFLLKNFLSEAECDHITGLVSGCVQIHMLFGKE